MLSKLRTFSLVGIEALPVEVEVDVSAGALPKTVLVGLPEAAVKESTHRVERAIVNSGFMRAHDRVVINLAPAELPKQAASFDLPITLGILAASGQITSEKFESYAVVGELALDGNTRPTKGALSMAIAAREQPGLRGLVVPAESAAEAAVVEGVEVIAVSSLAQAVAFFTGQIEIDPTPPRLDEWFRVYSAYDVDFADVRGQEMAKRAITIAAAGAATSLLDSENYRVFRSGIRIGLGGQVCRGNRQSPAIMTLAGRGSSPIRPGASGRSHLRPGVPGWAGPTER